MKKTIQGFTLIELMIAIAIIGVLLSIAYPSYTNSLKKARCEEAKRTLVEAAQHLENYYAMNLTYSGASSTDVASGNSSPTTLTLNNEFTDHYQLTTTIVSTTSSSNFTVSATETDLSAAADACYTLSLASNNQTTPASGVW